MKIMTDYIGEVEYSEDDIIIFEDGLYGLEENKRFMLIGAADEDIPFSYLQSLDDVNLALVVVDPFQFINDYEFKLPAPVIDNLGISDENEVLVKNVVVIPERINDARINLAAPIIINVKASKAKQIILNEDYPCRHRLFQK